MSKVTMPEPAMFNASVVGGVIYSHGYTATQMEAYKDACVREVQQWQTIETAPKDGRQILLTNGESVAQGWWEHEEPYIREKRDIGGFYIGQDESDGFAGWLDCEGGMQPDPPPLDATTATTYQITNVSYGLTSRKSVTPAWVGSRRQGHHTGGRNHL